jgi:hypothetical protein
VEHQTNYTPNESPENSRQEKLKIFKNRRINKKFHIKDFVRKNSTGGKLNLNPYLGCHICIFRVSILK